MGSIPEKYMYNVPKFVISWCCGQVQSLNDVIQKTENTEKLPTFTFLPSSFIQKFSYFAFR